MLSIYNRMRLAVITKIKFHKKFGIEWIILKSSTITTVNYRIEITYFSTLNHSLNSLNWTHYQAECLEIGSKIWQWFLGCETKSTGYKRKQWVNQTTSRFKTSASNGTMKRVERRSTERERIFTNCTSNKGLISGLYEELLKLPNSQSKQPDFKMSEGPQQTFISSRKTYRWQHSTSQIIREKRIKIKWAIISHPLRWLLLIIRENKKCWQGRGDIESLVLGWWECQMV